MTEQEYLEHKNLRNICNQALTDLSKTRAVLADIGISTAMDIETIRRKAARVYRETAKAIVELK